MADLIYDYIIAGGGAAGLSLAYQMSRSPSLKDKRILIIDKDLKKSNDRTWCFWTAEKTDFESVLFKQWENILFKSEIFSGQIPLAPYTYQMIRGIDFYNFVQEAIKKSPNIQVIQGEIIKTESESSKAIVHAADGKYYEGDYVFNSIWDEKKLIKKENYLYYKQHFKGYFIKVDAPTFDPTAATFMDLTFPQKDSEVRFFYILPFSPYEALVEYTLFSENLLPMDEYETTLKEYIRTQLAIEHYEIVEKEFGVIPMTDAPFDAQSSERVLNIGTASGCSKPSTGYTFMNIQRQVKAIVSQIEKNGTPIGYQKPSIRFDMYDSTLLNVIKNKRLKGSDIFGSMFKKHPIQRVLRFLDNQSNFAEELQIMASMPSLPFVLALPNVFRRFI